MCSLMFAIKATRYYGYPVLMLPYSKATQFKATWYHGYSVSRLPGITATRF